MKSGNEKSVECVTLATEPSTMRTVTNSNMVKLNEQGLGNGIRNEEH